MIKTLLNLPFVAKWINHELGGVITAAIAAAFSYAPKLIGFEFTPDVQHGVTLVAMAAAAGLVQYVQTGNAKALQTALGLESPDGHIGPVTIRTAQLATDEDVRRTISTNATPTGYPLGTRK